MSTLREVERYLRAQDAIGLAFEKARIPDWLLAHAYETLRKHGITP